MKIVDLTHTITPETPTFDTGCGFSVSTTVDYADCKEPNLFRVQNIEFRAGIGTHMDAPAHCVPGSSTIEALPLESLVTDCVVIRTQSDGDEHCCIMPGLVERFEQQHGRIKPNTFVLFSTGWGARWSRPESYHNGHVSPSVHLSTAEFLLERDIAGIGIDALSADSGAADFPVHRAVLGAGKYLVENVANAEDLPPTGAQIFVLPMKIGGATEAPLRLIALVQ